MRDLAGKGVFITGAASGIGRGMARAFAGAGMKLALADLERDPLAEVEAELKQAGAHVLALELDVTDRAAVQAAGSQVAAQLGKLHLLCNNAGVGSSATPLQDETADNWDWVLGVNLMGQINVLLAFLPLIQGHGEGGHIVNTSSMSGLRVRAGKGQGIYVTTKAGIIAMSEALRIDLGGTEIGVSVLCPGPVASNIQDSGRNRPEKYGGRFQKPADDPLKRASNDGFSADAVGRRVRLAVEEDDFYIVTHATLGPEFKARADEILAAIEREAALGFDYEDGR